MLLIASAGTCHYFTRGFSGASFEFCYFLHLLSEILQLRRMFSHQLFDWPEV